MGLKYILKGIDTEPPDRNNNPEKEFEIYP